MMTLDLELEEALIQTLFYLKSEHQVIYKKEEGEQMLRQLLSLSNPKGQEDFLKLNLFMRGQFLLICSADNIHYFYIHHFGPLTLAGLACYWSESLAASRYRNKKLVA